MGFPYGPSDAEIARSYAEDAGEAARVGAQGSSSECVGAGQVRATLAVYHQLRELNATLAVLVSAVDRLASKEG